jgi:hypothetical protein
MSTALRPLDLRAGRLDDLDVVVRLGLLTRTRGWFAVHRRSVQLLAVLLPAVGVLHAWNMYRSPAVSVNDDEGTYVSQAWAVETWHQLAHYTYWYDHPPLGWIQIAAYTALTGAWSRAPYSVAAGREFMLVVDVVASGLVFVLARRLRFSRVGAAAALVLFAASPLSLHYHRMVWLDNLGTMWLLAALILAASQRRSLAAAVGSAACLTVAVLTKETLLVLVPVVGALLWWSSDVRTRRYRVTAFSALLASGIFFYPLYAMVKNEFLDGPGHVSLLWSIKWQLFLREKSGSILTPGSGATDYVKGLLQMDPWLLVGGLALAVPALFVPRLRLLAVALLVQAALPMRPGYLPQAYVVAMLPFTALVAVGLTDHLVRRAAARWSLRAGCAVAMPAVLAVLAMAFTWIPGDAQQLTAGGRVGNAEAVRWVKAHIGTNVNIVVDDNVWLDLFRAGYRAQAARPAVVWVYKVGSDAAVQLKSIDYFVYAISPVGASRQVPEIVTPFEHSKVIATFGTGDNIITVRKVDHTATAIPTSR